MTTHDANPPPATRAAATPAAPMALHDAVKALMHGWSLEATQPKVAELEALRAHLEPGAQVYVSAPPHVPWPRLLEHVRRVADAGFEPIPHVAVRNYESREALHAFLTGLADSRAVRRALVIAGDRATPAGPFSSSLQAIQSGLFQEAGLRAVDIAGYPEGHATIPLPALRKALRAKVYAARSGGLDVQVVTQFSFDGKALLSWLSDLRYEFPSLPIAVGLAGPADVSTLLRFALRCGVRASARGLGRGLSLLGNLSVDRTPLRLVRMLAEGWVQKGRGGLSLHFYAFGGTARSAAWAQALLSGAVDLDGPER